MKLQTLTLSNGMFGSVYIGPMRVSDVGLMNISDLDTYLSQLFREFSMHVCGASNQFPAVYGDRIFPQLSTTVARYLTPDKNEDRINTRLASVRQSIERIFGFHTNTFTLFSNTDRCCLLISGTES